MMTDENFQHYLNVRFKDLHGFYDSRSKTNKRFHWWTSGYVIVISGLVPVFIATKVISAHPFIYGVLSATLVVVAAWKEFAQYHENWLRYRRTWDALNRENALFLVKAGEYSESERCNCLFVEQVKAIVDIEGRDWEARHSPRAKGTDAQKRSEC